MKTKKFIKKVSRYLVLSKEFEQKESDLFKDRAVGLDTVTNSSGDGHSLDAIRFGAANDFTTPSSPATRSEVILSKAKAEASRSDRYDEYKKLQIELEKYLEDPKLKIIAKSQLKTMFYNLSALTPSIVKLK